MDRRVPAFVLVAFLAACGGGGSSGGGGGITPPGVGGSVPTPTSSPALPASQTQSASLGPTQSTVTFSQIASGAAGTLTLPAASASATATLVLQSTLPSGVPSPAAARIPSVAGPKALGGAVSPLAYITLTLSAPVSISSTPAFAFTFPPGTLSGFAYVAVYDPTMAASGWNPLLGPVPSSGTTLSFPADSITPAYNLSANVTYVFAIVQSASVLPTPTPTASPTPSGSSTPVPGTATPLPNITSQNGWSPYQVANELQFPVQSGYDGTGQTVAIIMDADYNASGLSSYLAAFSVPPTSRTVIVKAGPDGPASGTNDAQEAQLDVETIAGLAPGSNIIEYTMPSLSDQYFLDTVNQVITDGQAKVISYSAGGCEFSSETADVVLTQAAKAGIAVVASSGDQGNECWSGPNTYVPGVDWPAVDPNVISVGGTNSVNAAFTYTDPTLLQSNAVWNDSNFCNKACAGGGGISQYVPLPSYQSGLAGVSSASLRNVPDVSMPAEGMAMFDGTNWWSMYGTSWSAPEYAAFMAELYEYCNTAIANPVAVPYYVFAHSSNAFIDVTLGTDQFMSSTPYYAAAAGYDNASGIGVPLGMPFADTICPGRTLAAAPRAAAASYATRGTAVDRVVDVSPRVRALADVGPRPDGMPTRVQIVLRPTPTIASDEQNVIAALRSAGFTIERTFSNHLIVDASAPSGAVERFFRARMEDVSEGGYGTRYMPVTQAVLPAAIAPYVAGVNLDDVVTMRVPLTR